LHPIRAVKPRQGRQRIAQGVSPVEPVNTTRQAPQGRKRCAGHVQQLGGESPLPNLMEVKG